MKTQNTNPVASSVWFCVLVSIAESGIVVWAVITELSGPGNIVKLLAIINGVLWPAALILAAKSKDVDSRPKWLKHWMTFCDISQTLILCWCGWWWCSCAYGFGAIGSAAVRYRKGTQNAPAHRPEAEQC